MSTDLDNMKGLEISVDGKTCYTFPNTTQPNFITDVKCSQARKGKIVTFTSRKNKQLVLCEVQIWGKQFVNLKRKRVRGNERRSKRERESIIEKDMV